MYQLRRQCLLGVALLSALSIGWLGVAMPTTYAHEVGQTYEEVKDGLLIDVGYSPEELLTDMPTRFDFSLFPAGDTPAAAAEFTAVWVRITQADAIHFSGMVHRLPSRPAAFLTQLSSAGEYEVEVRYLGETETVVATTFTVAVRDAAFPTDSEQSAFPGLLYGLAGCGGLLFLLGIGMVFRPRQT